MTQSSPPKRDPTRGKSGSSCFISKPLPFSSIPNVPGKSRFLCGTDFQVDGVDDDNDKLLLRFISRNASRLAYTVVIRMRGKFASVSPTFKV